MFRPIARFAGMTLAFAALSAALPVPAQPTAEPAGTVQLHPVPNLPQPVITVPEPALPPDASGGYRPLSGAGSEDAGMRDAERVAPLPAPAPQSALQARTENGVTYLCGGIGQEEAEQMKQRAQGYAQGYGLMLTFAARNGSYLANVQVEIDDAEGKPVLKTTCDAPMMLLDLPQAGNYRVRAEAGGYTVTRTISKSGRAMPSGQARNIVMTWPKEAAGVEGGTMSGGGAPSGRSGMR